MYVESLINKYICISNTAHRYPDATPEELSSGDNVCIICREEMTTGCKKLPCNHIFHANCLRSWFQRQQTCPTCRMDILRATPPTRPQNAPQQPGQGAGAGPAALATTLKVGTPSQEISNRD